MMEPGFSQGVAVSGILGQIDVFHHRDVLAIVILVVPIGVGRFFIPRILRDSRNVWPDNRGQELDPQEKQRIQAY